MRCAFAICLLLLTAACQEELAADDLLHIDEVAPDVIEPGQLLIVTGKGFPTGNSLSVRLSGVLHRPLDRDLPVETTLTGIASSEERVEVPFPESTLRTLGGRGTFRGTLSVSFRSPSLEAWVRGSVPLVLDLVPTSSLNASSERPLDLVTMMGLTFDPDASGELGLRVQNVANAELPTDLRRGDRIHSIDGLRILWPSELRASRDAERTVLEIAGDAVPTRALSIRLAADLESIPAASIRTYELASIVALLALLTLGPLGTLLGRLEPLPRRRAPWGVILLAALASVVLRSTSAWASDLGTALPVLVLLALRAVFAPAFARADENRIVAFGRGAWGLAILGIGFAAMCCVTGSSSLEALESSQGPWPWQFNVLRSPTGLLSCLLTALAARSARPAVLWHRVIDDVALAAIGTAASMALLGGGALTLALASAPYGLGALKALPTPLLATCFALLLRRVRDAQTVWSSTWLVPLGSFLAVLTLASSLWWTNLELSPALQRAFGEVAGVAIAFVLLRIVITRPSPAFVPRHPLL